MRDDVVMPPEVSLSGKMEVLDRMLVKLLAAGHKVMPSPGLYQMQA